MLAGVDLVLVRHAESIWNAEGRWQGQTDVPLSAAGRAEAARLGARLARTRFDRRICSDLERTRDTAVALGGAFEPRHAWREMDLGAWGGLLHTEVKERFPDDVAAMIAGSPARIGGGESMPGFEARAQAALDAVIAESRPGERVLVVTHGGVIRAIVMRLLGLEGGRPLVGATNTSITHLRITAAAGREPLAQLVSYNCGVHLVPEEGPVPPKAGAPGEDELATGDPEEVVRRTAARLGLRPDAAARLHPPAPGSITRLLPGDADPRLRCVAVPADVGAEG
jgi:broad specificity phosphatase PhoE